MQVDKLEKNKFKYYKNEHKVNWSAIHKFDFYPI